MSEFRLTQISDTHLARRLRPLIANFERVSEYIDATRPDLVVNSGDIAFDGPTQPRRPRICEGPARRPARRLPLSARQSRYRRQPDPGRPGAVAARHRDRTGRRSFPRFGDDRWRFEAAGWCFVGLNSLVMNTGLVSEAEQFDWLASELACANGKPVALFLHKPIYLNAPDDPELEASAIRYVPMPARRRLVEMLRSVDLRLVASGHVHQRRDYTFGGVRNIWAPSAGFIISDARQERIGVKEVGLVEYRFQPDSFEVRHVRAPGQVDVDLDQLHRS